MEIYQSQKSIWRRKIDGDSKCCWLSSKYLAGQTREDSNSSNRDQDREYLSCTSAGLQSSTSQITVVGTRSGEFIGRRYYPAISKPVGLTGDSCFETMWRSKIVY